MACVCCQKCCYPPSIDVQVSGFTGGAMIYNTLSSSLSEPPSLFRWDGSCSGKPDGSHIIPSTVTSTRDQYTSMSLSEMNGSWALQGSCGVWSQTKAALCPWVRYLFNPSGSTLDCSPKDGTVSISVVRIPNTTDFTLSGYVASGFISANFSTVIACNQTIKNIPNTNPAQQQCCDNDDGPGFSIAGSYSATIQGSFPYSPNYDKYPITIQIQ